MHTTLVFQILSLACFSVVLGQDDTKILLEHLDPNKCLRPMHQCGKTKDILVMSPAASYNTKKGYGEFCDKILADSINLHNWICFCDNEEVECTSVFKIDFMNQVSNMNKNEVSRMISKTKASGEKLTVCNTFVLVAICK